MRMSEIQNWYNLISYYDIIFYYYLRVDPLGIGSNHWIYFCKQYRMRQKIISIYKTNYSLGSLDSATLQDHIGYTIFLCLLYS